MPSRKETHAKIAKMIKAFPIAVQKEIEKQMLDAIKQYKKDKIAKQNE